MFLHTNFSYELWAAFSRYVLALAKNWYEKRVQKKIDEIDGSMFFSGIRLYMSMMLKMLNMFD